MSKKTILVTGGCGFIGSNFINYLGLHREYYIICIDNMYYSASLYNIDEKIRNSELFTFYKGNINNIQLIDTILHNHSVTDIIHFAAQSHVDSSFSDSLQYTEDNIKGTHTLLESIKRNFKHINFYHFSTDEVYGESKDNNLFNETSILQPTNPYAATKAAAEMLVVSYKFSFKLKTIIIRCNNVYGPNQYPEKLLPKFVNLLKNNKKMLIHGDGTYSRSFIHVDDVCRAVDIILHNGIFGEVYNIYSDEEYSVLDIAKIILNCIKPDEYLNNWIEYTEDRPFNDKRYLLDGTKINKLGWKPIKKLKNEIKRLIGDV